MFFLSVQFFFFLIQLLKITAHLQLLQNIGCISCVVQHICVPVIYPVVCTSHPPCHIGPSLTGNHECVLCIGESTSVLLCLTNDSI